MNFTQNFFKNIKNLTYAGLTLMLMFSCTKNEIVDVSTITPISFSPSIGVSTKAQESVKQNLSSFTVRAWNKTNNTSETGASQNEYSSEYFKSTVRLNNKNWQTENTYYWPKNTLGFFAYANIEESICNANETKGLQFKDFSPAENIKKQKDVIVAYNEGKEEDFNLTVPLLFKHILNQVEVQAYCANPNIKIEVTGLKIGNIKSKGDFTLPTVETVETSTENNITEKWDNLSTKTDYTIEFGATTLVNRSASESDKGFTSLMGSDDKNIKENGTWMLIPQTVNKWTTGPSSSSDGAYLGIKCRITSKPSKNSNFDNEETQLFPEDISNTEGWTAIPLNVKWEAGMKYTYKLEFCGDGGGAGFDPNDPTKPILGGPIKFVDVTVQDWEEGKSVNIPNLTKKPQIKITGNNALYAYYEGDTTKIKLQSVYNVFNGDKQVNTRPLAWQAQFSTDGKTWSNDKPSWINMPVKGKGGDCEEIEIEVKHQKNTAEINKYNKPLRTPQATITGSEDNPIDLSDNKDISSKETANCYIVNAPGYYKLPLIIGNGKDKNGNLQEHKNLSASFVNYKGDKISDVGYVINNAAKCTIVWQDVENLVSKLHLSTDKDNASSEKFLEFYVAPSTILTGNAVVAVMDDSNNIIWSWHIWVTPYKLGENDITENVNILNENGNKKTTQTNIFMCINLGWAEDQEGKYDERTMNIRFIAPEEPNNAISEKYEIVQFSTEIASKGGRNTYYQWGRKDPMLPANGLSKNSNNTYDNAMVKQWGPEKFKHKKRDQATTIEKAISNPNILYYQEKKEPSNWCEKLYLDLWNYNAKSKIFEGKIVKTIYDPSPAGYVIPGHNAFNGCTNNDTEITSKSFDNYYSEYPGRDFNNTLFLPASGFYHFDDGNLKKVGREGSYWCSSTTNGDYGVYLFFDNSKKATPQHSARQASALAVRPIRVVE